MQETLTIGLIQGATIWQDAAANRLHYAERMSACMQSRQTNQPSIDVMVLPETFTSGFGADQAKQPNPCAATPWHG